MLEFRQDCPRLKSADMERYPAELWGLIEETERRWPNEPFWHDPRGRHVREFSTYSHARSVSLNSRIRSLARRTDLAQEVSGGCALDLR